MNAARTGHAGYEHDHGRATPQVVPTKAAREDPRRAEECGCAPTPAESRELRAGVSRRTLLGAGTAGLVAPIVAGPLLPSAFAATVSGSCGPCTPQPRAC